MTTRSVLWTVVIAALADLPAAAQEELRDVKPPLDAPGVSPWWWLLVIPALAGIGLVVWGRCLRRPSRPEPPLSAGAIALQELDALQAAGLARRGEVKSFYVRLSDIVRRYLEARFQLRAPEMTTEEFLRDVQASGRLSPLHRDPLHGFLQQCDRVKFARHQAGVDEMEESFILARRFVEETREKRITGLED